MENELNPIIPAENHEGTLPPQGMETMISEDAYAAYIKQKISRGYDDLKHGRTTKQSDAESRPVPWKRK